MSFDESNICFGRVMYLDIRIMLHNERYVFCLKDGLNVNDSSVIRRLKERHKIHLIIIIIIIIIIMCT